MPVGAVNLSNVPDSINLKLFAVNVPTLKVTSFSSVKYPVLLFVS